MLYPGLSLEQAPPLSVPARFFISAPLFGMLFGLGLVWLGHDAFTSRWTPQAIGLVHLLTLGVLGMVMCGALFQMLPVVAGAPVVRPKLISTLVHIPLSLGVLSLSFGLVMGIPALLQWGVILLALGLAVFLPAIGWSLLCAARVHDTVRGMRFAVFAFGMAAVIGLVLAAGHGFDSVALARFPFTALHVAWALVGWVVLLVMAVAYQVVPLFQMTPDYPRWLTRWFAASLFGLLLLFSALQLLQAASWLTLLVEVAGAMLLTVFAVQTLDLQRRRKRKLPDVTRDFWRVAMFSLVLAGWCGVASHWIDDERFQLLTGILFLLGFGLSAINGMLYKIVPFLVWFHLQNQMLAASGVTSVGNIPHMKAILPDRRARLQLRVHLLATALVLPAGYLPVPFMALAGFAYLISFGGLGWNLLNAFRLFRRELSRMVQGAPG